MKSERAVGKCMSYVGKTRMTWPIGQYV